MTYDLKLIYFDRAEWRRGVKASSPGQAVDSFLADEPINSGLETVVVREVD